MYYSYYQGLDKTSRAAREGGPDPFLRAASSSAMRSLLTSRGLLAIGGWQLSQRLLLFGWYLKCTGGLWFEPVVLNWGRCCPPGDVAVSADTFGGHAPWLCVCCWLHGAKHPQCPGQPFSSPHQGLIWPQMSIVLRVPALIHWGEELSETPSSHWTPENIPDRSGSMNRGGLQHLSCRPSPFHPLKCAQHPSETG